MDFSYNKIGKTTKSHVKYSFNKRRYNCMPCYGSIYPQWEQYLNNGRMSMTVVPSSTMFLVPRDIAQFDRPNESKQFDNKKICGKCDMLNSAIYQAKMM